MSMLLALLLCAPPWLCGSVAAQDSAAELIDRLDARVAPLKDAEVDYSLDIPVEDRESDAYRWRVRASLVRGKALRIDAHHPQVRADEDAVGPYSVRYLYTPESFLFELSTLEPRARGAGIPLGLIRFRSPASRLRMRDLDPFLAPPEFLLRLFFDDPLLIASLAPKLVLSLEPNLAARRDGAGWVLESAYSLIGIGRRKELPKLPLAAVLRRYRVDGSFRIVRAEVRLIPPTEGEATPLLAFSVRKWQEVAGVSIPAEIEIGYGGVDAEENDRFDRRRVRRVAVLRANSGVTVAADDDVAADLPPRRPGFYDTRPADFRFAAIHSRFFSGTFFADPASPGGRAYVEPDDLAAEFERALEARPDSPVLRSSLLFVREADGFEEAAEKYGASAPPDVKAWLFAQGRKVGVDPAALSETGRDVWAAAHSDASFLREELKTRPFARRVDLATALARRESDLSKEIPLCAALGGDAAALAEVAADPAAAGFVVDRVRDRLGKEDEEILAAAPHLRKALEAAARAREDDPLAPALLGVLAAKTGAESALHFRRAFVLAAQVPADSPGVEAAFLAVLEAAACFPEDEAHLVGAADAFVGLVARLGRPSASLFNDPRRSPLLLLASLWTKRGKFAELYRAIRRLDWNDDRCFSGIEGVLEHAGGKDAFVNAAIADCRKRADAGEHAALARLLRRRLRTPERALEVAAEAKRLAPKEPDVLRTFAECASGDDAVGALLALAAAGPRERAMLGVAEIEIGRKRFDAARSALRGLDLESDPTIAQRAGAVWEPLGDDAAALRCYRAAAAGGRRCLLAMGRVLERSGDFPEAMRCYNRAFAAGELAVSKRLLDPRTETDAEWMKKKMYRKIGDDYFLKPFLSRSFAPLPKAKRERVRTLLAALDEEALEELREIGPEAAPILADRKDDPAIRAILLEWAEPR